MTSTADRPFAASTPTQQLAHRRSDCDVETGQRFVEQQHVGFGGQRARERDALRLPAGQLRGHAIGEVGGVDLGQPVRGRCSGLSCG